MHHRRRQQNRPAFGAFHTRRQDLDTDVIEIFLVAYNQNGSMLTYKDVRLIDFIVGTATQKAER